MDADLITALSLDSRITTVVVRNANGVFLLHPMGPPAKTFHPGTTPQLQSATAETGAAIKKSPGPPSAPPTPPYFMPPPPQYHSTHKSLPPPSGDACDDSTNSPPLTPVLEQHYGGGAAFYQHPPQHGFPSNNSNSALGESSFATTSPVLSASAPSFVPSSQTTPIMGAATPGGIHFMSTCVNAPPPPYVLASAVSPVRPPQ